ncbi:MAG: penicillin-binding protein, partial [Zwartia sp.]
MSKFTDQRDHDEPKEPKRHGSWIIGFFLKLTILSAGLALCGALLFSMALALAWPNVPELTAMTDYRPRVPLRIFTADKVMIGEFGEE